ncbi:MAG: glycosyltransferase [Bacteroidota bacterium]|nr:glycosyltransferase [Bacteroidota bacterium]
MLQKNIINKKDKLLSIIVPAYNAWPYITDMVDSILSQTFKDYDLIIVNDGSTDKTYEYLKNIRDERVKVINKNNSGIIDSFNIALQQIYTPFVARMDADDICDPTKYERQIKYLIEHENCVLVGTSANHLSIDGKVSGWPVNMPKSHEEIIDALFKRRSAIIQPTIVVRTKALKEIGGYSPDVWPEDYNLYFKLGKKGQMANLPECLYSIRLHESSLTSKNMIKLQTGYDNLMRIYWPEYHKEYGDTITLKASNAFLLRMDILSVILYRKGIYDFLNKRKAAGIMWMFCASALNLKRFGLYVKRRLNKWFKK